VFLADDVLLFPFKSLLKVFQEIYKAALEEIKAEADAIRNELSQLYLALEAGSVSEDAFDARERELLDRLDDIEGRGLLEDEDEGDSADEDNPDTDTEVILNRRFDT
jgi:Gas vesicle protein G